MTYTSLIQMVEDYINRLDTDTINRIPTFIELAQHQLSDACKTVGQEDYIVSQFIPGVSVYQKPVGWRRSVSINFGTGADFNTRKILELQVYEYLRLYTKNPDDNTKWGEPLFYSDYGFTNFLVAPTPLLAYPFEFCYIKIPDLLSVTNQTNFWTNFSPSLLFNSTMFQAHFFLQNYDQASAYQVEVEKGTTRINDQDTLRKVDRNSEREVD